MSLPHQPRPSHSVDLLAGAAVFAGFAAAAYVWRYGPAGPLPMHLDFHGRVNGWGDRTTIAKMLGGLTIGFALIYAALGWLTLGPGADGAARRGLRTTKVLLVFLETTIIVVTLGMAYGAASAPALGGGRLMSALLASIFLGVGALIGKAGPNPFVGVRTYWTFRSRLAWDKANRLIGRLLFWVGLLGVPSSVFLDPAIVTPALIVSVLLAAVVSVFESWRVWRADPERQMR